METDEHVSERICMCGMSGWEVEGWDSALSEASEPETIKKGWVDGDGEILRMYSRQLRMAWSSQVYTDAM